MTPPSDAGPGHPRRRRTFEIVFFRKMSMVMEVDGAVGMATSEGEQLHRAEQELVEPSGKSQGPMHQVVDRRGVGQEAQQHRTGERRDPPAACGEREEGSGQREGQRQ